MILNELNLSLQEESTNILESSSKIEAFENKLTLWQGELNKSNTEMFPCFSEFTKENNLDFLLFKNFISSHMIKSGENFSRRFEKFPDNELGWIRDPFSFGVFQSNKSLTCQTFWLSIGNEYADLKKKTIDILLQFASTYFCETSFTKLVAIKTKYRTRLDPEDDLRLAISSTDPNIKAIMNLCNRISHIEFL
ncbi:Protein FAM200A [Araneus ventricosus]|uniref:Protein FAM200A n=1 Tax=Araneus ventricosus TaxID=182803 RepID=A0A4Y2AY17_ARAVE|nr:Protein FAM200A [Araneus ventricosus]